VAAPPQDVLTSILAARRLDLLTAILPTPGVDVLTAIVAVRRLGLLRSALPVHVATARDDVLRPG